MIATKYRNEHGAGHWEIYLDGLFYCSCESETEVEEVISELKGVIPLSF